MRLKNKLLTGTCVSAMIACAFMASAHANPVDGTITAGSATISASGKTLDITQYSDKAIIDWRGFDIDADETTNFIQPNSGSITLNRVHSSQASTINGRLNANGNIIIINQNGIIFGAGSQVDVHGLVATTSDVDNNDFMQSSRVHFNLPGNTSASIINNGTITAHDAGLVGFVAPNVENNGIITANLGRVHLASGDKATVDFYGDGLMEVEVSDNVQSQIVTNTGSITADGGKIALTAAAGGQIVHSIINAQGSMRAQSVGVHNGQIVIGAAGAHRTGKSGRAVVNVAGNLDASGRGTGSKGGAITITGDDIVLASTAHLDSSGDLGGGVIKIGGDYHGQGSLQSAANLTVHGGAIILNDAITSGNGGDTTLWSDLVTYFKGFIGARGGNTSGKGGFVEVSGHDFLHYDGLVDLSAKNEDEYGTLLLDPSDITISSAADSGGSFAGGVYTPSGATSVINTATLVTQLASAGVTINTSSAFAGNGDITIANTINSAGGKNLTLVSDRDIIVNAAVTLTAGNSAFTATAGRDLTFNANVSANGSGTFNVQAARNLTVSAGVTVASGATGSTFIKAAGGVITNVGLLTINGAVSAGTAGLTLLNGLDIGGATRTNDLTLAAGNFTMQGGTVNVTNITGFRDININTALTSTSGITIAADRDLTTNAVITAGTNAALSLTSTTRDVTFNANVTAVGTGGITAQAARNLTIGASATISSGSSGALSLKAAGGNIANTGILTNSGTLNVGGSGLTLLSGLDGSSVRTDYTFTASNLTVQAGSAGGLTMTGFRDVTINTAIPGAGTVSITAERDLFINANYSTNGANSLTFQAARNLTVASGVTLTSGPTGGLSLKAATGVITNVGLLTINGTLSNGTGNLTLLNGLDIGGATRTNDLTLTTGNLTFQGASVGAVSITGYRDVTLNRTLTSGSAITITADRDLTVGALISETSNGAVTLTTNTRDILFNAGVSNAGNVGTTATAFRDLTVASGVTITASNNSPLSLRAANNSINNIGTLTINGNLTVGSNSNLVLVNGLDASSARTVDFTLNNSMITFSTATGGSISISGYRDITLATSLPATSVSAVAQRNLTINSGVTVSSSAGSSVTLQAAGGVTTNIGVFTNNGVINVGTGTLSLITGLDASSARTVDLTLDGTNFLIQGGSTLANNVGISGFRDINLNRSFTFTSVANVSIIANRNLTIGTGAVITNMAGNTLTLAAANNVITNTGLLTINGTLNANSGAITLLNGLDANGTTRTNDLTLNASNMTLVGATMGVLTISGFRDLTIDRNITSSVGLTLTAERNFTINAGSTLTSGAGGTVVLKAAGGVITNSGVFTNNGMLSVGTSTTTIVSGLNGSSILTDIAFNTSNFTMQGATIGSLTLTGFRDIDLNRSLAFSGAQTFTANRNLTIGTGATISSGAATALTLNAAGGVMTNQGLLTINGTINQGTAGLTLLNGLDIGGAARTNDLTLSNSNLTYQGAAIGALTITGFRDIAFNNNFTSNSNVAVTAERNLTIAGSTVFTSGSGGTLSLRAAGGAIANTGLLSINGTLNAGSNAFTLVNGLDANGTTRTKDLTINAGLLTYQATNVNNTSITGFRDVVFASNFNSSGTVTVTAERDLTINSGATITSAATGGVVLKAAGGVLTNTGIFTLNGTLNVGSGNSVLQSGLDSGGNKVDLTLDNSTLTFNGANFGQPSLSGFRDINLNRSMTFATTAVTITAARNLTIGAGATITSGAALALTLNAAGGVTTNQGLLTINGTINQGSAALTLVNGFDIGGGTRTNDLTLTTSNLTLQGAGIGALTISGFRDINHNRALAVAGATITADRDLTFNANLTQSAGSSITAQAGRNLTIATGVALMPSTSGSMSLKAAGGVTTNIGILTLNGSFNAGTGALTLLNGLDANGTTRTNDITLTTSNVFVVGATVGAVSITGFRDVTLSRDLPGSSTFVVQAERDLTLSTGVTVASGSASAVSLKAAGGVITNTGVLTLNGIINTGSSALTLVTGQTGGANITDLTLNGTNLLTQTATMGAPVLNGFRDINLNRSLTFSVATTITAIRNLTVGTGATIASGPAVSLVLNAANNVATNTGIFTNSGTISSGTAALTIVSGVDGSGNRTDITLDGTNFLMQSAAMGALTLTGFRDITLSRNLSFNAAETITANRNLTLSAGATLTSGSGTALTLNAANNSVNGTGILTLNGVINIGTGALTLLSGQDGSNNRPDYTVTTTNLTLQGATPGPVSISGFRDITIDRDLLANGALTLAAQRNLTINSGINIRAVGASNMTLTAANNAIGTVGLLTMNGIMSIGTGALIMTSGVDGSGNRNDFTLTSSNLALQSANMGTMSLSGFRDINLNRGVVLTGATVTAERNLTINNTQQVTGGGAVAYKAAGGLTSNTGIVTLNAAISLGTGALTLTSGVDSVTGIAANLTLNSSNFIMNAGTIASSSITGFYDVLLNTNMTSAAGTSSISITAVHNLTVGTGVVLTPGNGGNLTLRAANNSVNGTGVFVNNGVLNIGGSAAILTLVSGIDSVSGQRADLTLNSSNLTIQAGGYGLPSLSGFRDLTFNRDLTLGGTVTAYRNLTIGAGVTITGPGAGGLNLYAANGVTTATGTLINNGLISLGTGGLQMISGLDGSGNSVDITLNTSNFQYGASLGSFLMNGFRDITFDRDMAGAAGFAITAMRNITVNAGKTVGAGSSSALSLLAANNVVTGTGTVTNNGTISIATGVMTLLSGLDGSGNRADLTLTNTNTIFTSGTASGPTFTGFRDITISRNLTTTGSLSITAYRNLTVDAGVTLASGGTSGITLRAANNVIGNQGLLTINGILSLPSTAGFTLVSGTDGSTGRADFALTNANFIMSGGSIGAVSFTGFRDVEINSNLNSNSSVAVVAERNLTIGAGATVTTGGTGGTNLKAAGAVSTGTGVLIINGVINNGGTGSQNMTSGIGTNGQRVDFTFNATNYLMPVTASAISVSGFRDITVDRNITVSGTPSLTAYHNLIINSGVTLTGGAASGITLTAAGGNVNGNGVVLMNGTLNTGTGLFFLNSGFDDSGNRASITLSNTSLLMQGATLGPSISGFDDININRDITFSAGVQVFAKRNITIAAGVTVTAAGNLVLSAAGQAITGTGLLTIDGKIVNNGGSLTLLSGKDSSGAYTADLLLDAAHFQQNTATTGALTFTGFRDITIAQDLTGNGTMDIEAQRNLTINAGVTLQNGLTGFLGTLWAAGGVVTNVGQIINNGLVKFGSSLLSLITGTDSSGNRPDLVWDNLNKYQLQSGAVFGNGMIKGFRDITIAADFITNGGNQIVAERNLTINAGILVQSLANNFNTLHAAGGNVNNIGLLVNNGIVSNGTSSINLLSGVDSAGNRVDFDWNSAHYVLQGATIGVTNINGFRDVTFSQNLTSTGGVQITAMRNLTIPAGITITNGATNGMTLQAAGAVPTDLGVLTIDGTVNAGTNVLNLISGHDASGNRPDFIWNNTHVLQQGGINLGIYLSGFRDITIANNLVSNSYVDINADRNLTVNAGVTTTSGTGNSNTFTAAGKDRDRLGILTISGMINLGSAGIVLNSGLDGSGNRVDLTLDSTHFNQTSATNTLVNITGFRDLTFGMSLNVTGGTLSAITSRNLTINSGVTLSSFSSLALASGNFINNAGANALHSTNNYWVVYSTDPHFDTIGNLLYDYQIFNCAFSAGCTVPAGLNGFIYSGNGNAAFFDHSAAGTSVIPDSVTYTSQNPYSNHAPIIGTAPGAASVTRTFTDEGMTFTTTATLFGLPSNAFISPDDITLTFAPELVEQYGLHDWDF